MPVFMATNSTPNVHISMYTVSLNACLWVIVCYCTINCGDVLMPRSNFISIDIGIVLVVVCGEYIRAYNTGVSMRVKFNRDLIFKGSIKWQ